MAFSISKTLILGERYDKAGYGLDSQASFSPIPEKRRISSDLFFNFSENLLKAKDVPLAAISKALGHSKIAAAMRYLRVGVWGAPILAGSGCFRLPAGTDD